MMFDLTKYLFIIPLIISVLLILKYLVEKKSIFKLKGIKEIEENIKTKNKLGRIKYYFKRIFAGIGKYTSPPQKSKIYKFYGKFLRFTNFKVEGYFAIRFIAVVIGILLLILIRYTNISIYTQEIFNNYEYKMDMIYRQDDRLVNMQRALDQEVKVLKIAIENVSYEEVRDENLKKQTMEKLIKLIPIENGELELSSETVANKVYYRLRDYYFVRNNNYSLYISIVIIMYLIFDGIVFVYNVFAKANAKIELRFLKKLVILNGNFQDSGFIELLNILIHKSKYYKKILMEIAEVNDKNTVDNKSVYRKIMQDIKDEDARLFFEKLEQANNSDFQYAIKNIEEEEELQEEERKIRVNARVEAIHSFGVVGAVILIYLLANYLLIPWLQAHDISAYY